MLPPWAGKKSKAVATYEIATSPHGAPGWRVVGDDIYTCVAPSGGPHVDPGVLKAIHSFDPGAIPIWRIQRFLPPGKMGDSNIVNIAHVGIARRVKAPKARHGLLKVFMPSNPKHPVPNVLEFIWRGDRPAYEDGGPAQVLPFDWKLYRYMTQRFVGNQSAVTMVKDWMKRTREKQEREALQSREELGYRQRHLEKNVQRILDNVTPKELMGQYLEARARKRLSLPKTYVFQGGR